MHDKPKQSNRELRRDIFNTGILLVYNVVVFSALEMLSKGLEKILK